MPPRASKAAAPSGAKDGEGAAWPRAQDVTRRFQRLIRTFAEALYFKQLAHVVGQDVLGQEKGLTDDQRRVLGLFMLSSWHGDKPLKVSEIVQHRAHAKERKRRETEYMSPDGSAKHLCNFTAIARGMSCALGKQFAAEEFKAVVVEFDSKAGQHQGVAGLNCDKLAQLLASKGITMDQFTAAMFTNVLTPERFSVLKADLAEVRRVKPKKEEDEAGAGPAPTAKAAQKPKAEAKAKAPVAEKKPAVRQARPTRQAGAKDAACEPASTGPPLAAAAGGVTKAAGGLFMASLLAPPSLGGAPSDRLLYDSPAFVETVAKFQKHPDVCMQAGLEELSLMWSAPTADASLALSTLEAASSFDLCGALSATPSWTVAADAAPSLGTVPSSGPTALELADALGATPSLMALDSAPALWPTLSFGRTLSGGRVAATLALQGMAMARKNPELSTPALRGEFASVPPVAAVYAGLGPTVSADGVSWIPASLAGVDDAPKDGLACCASGMFASVALARTSSLRRSDGSGGLGAVAPLLSEDTVASLSRVEELVNLGRIPDLDDRTAATYLSNIGVDMQSLTASLDALPGLAMSEDEFNTMLGLFRTISM